jgi:radical SAM protein with 4Fe4S-binding SPASM domain
MTLDQYIRPFPRVLRIEPASACNLKCSFCPTGTMKTPRGLMSDDTFQLIFQEIKDNLEAIKVVVFYHGGEPLLHKGFCKMVKQVKSLGIPLVKTVSNGMLLTDNLIKEIIDSGLDMIEFSLDGESPEENNFLRRNCDFRKVAGKIKRLIEFKQEKNAVSPQIFIANAQFLKQDDSPKLHIPDPPEYLIREFSGRYAGGIAGYKCCWVIRWPQIEVISEIYRCLSIAGDHETKNYCDHVENVMTIRWNGDIVPCCHDLMSTMILGNIHKTKLIAIWNNTKYLKLRKSIHTMKYPPLCSNCHVLKSGQYLTLKPGAMRSRQEAN